MMSIIKKIHRVLAETKISLEYHDELNPKLWDSLKLKPEVRDKLLAFAAAWAAFAHLPPGSILDVVMTGGNCNFNYTTKSDIDVHLIVDKDKLNPDRELVDRYLQDRKVVWTISHTIAVYGYPLEPYAADSAEKYPKDQGVYSLKRADWVQFPVRGEHDFKNDTILKKKVLFYVHMIDSLIKNKASLDAFDEVKQKVVFLRNSGIAKYGEFSYENALYKELRNRGAFDRMNKYMKTKGDEELSLA